MRTSSPEMTLPRTFLERETCDGDHASLDIELDEPGAQARVSDPRLFRPERRQYARRLLEALCDHPGVRKAEIDVATFTCRVDFDLASSSSAMMAGVFVDAVRSVSAGDDAQVWWRRSPRWLTLTVYRSRGAVSVWETHEEELGRLQLLRQFPAVDRAARFHLAESVAEIEGVDLCEVSPWSRRITVSCSVAEGRSVRLMVDRVERMLESPSAIAMGGADDVSSFAPLAPATGWKRLAYLTMAGGAFCMTLIGLIVPGVPTVPFLVATSYCLARSSPVLDGWLRRTAVFGPILREWEDHSALSLTSKGKLIVLTATILVVTVIFIPLNPLALTAIILVSSVSVFEIARTRALADDARPAIHVAGRRALPAASP